MATSERLGERVMSQPLATPLSSDNGEWDSYEHS
jgi:hypothetical protein